MITNTDYVGRFAPSPTGMLHTGSLFTAVASYLDARAHEGRWLVRMEDIDPDREQPNAAQSILNTLEKIGLEWDGDIWFQSTRTGQYEQAVQQLLKAHNAFYCTCSRKQIAASGTLNYPGTCRYCLYPSPPPNQPYAIRIKVPNKPVQFHDLIQGHQQRNLTQTSGDFVIKRKEGLYAYHLAVTLDDADQQITHIVRGHDLLESTFYHRYLQQLMKLPTPIYAHVPVLVNTDGQKLSKQTFATPIPTDTPSSCLLLCLQQLGLSPPALLKHHSPKIILDWAIEHWHINKLPKCTSLPDKPAQALQPDAT